MIQEKGIELGGCLCESEMVGGWWEMVRLRLCTVQVLHTCTLRSEPIPGDVIPLSKT